MPCNSIPGLFTSEVWTHALMGDGNPKQPFSCTKIGANNKR